MVVWCRAASLSWKQVRVRGQFGKGIALVDRGFHFLHQQGHRFAFGEKDFSAQQVHSMNAGSSLVDRIDADVAVILFQGEIVGIPCAAKHSASLGSIRN